VSDDRRSNAWRAVGWCAISALLFVAPVARAHDPYEAWTLAVVRSERLELGITMAQSTALRLIDPEMKARALTFQNFEAHRPRLEKEAAALFVLTSGRDTRLTANRVEVQLTDENDVVFKIAWPRPAPGRLHFRATFLAKLGQGYGGILEVSDTSGNHLGWEQLSWENPSFEVTVPAPKTK
jgi:hypothetical protein